MRTGSITKKTFGRILNILSGSAMCIGGAVLILKHDIVQGTTLITAGVAKMAAHELQTEEVKKVKQSVADINTEVLKTKQP
jgi:hypothetical protein